MSEYYDPPSPPPVSPDEPDWSPEPDYGPLPPDPLDEEGFAGDLETFIDHRVAERDRQASLQDLQAQALADGARQADDMIREACAGLGLTRVDPVAVKERANALMSHFERELGYRSRAAAVAAITTAVEELSPHPLDEVGAARRIALRNRMTRYA
jgi:hypothetical protein